MIARSSLLVLALSVPLAAQAPRWTLSSDRSLLYAREQHVQTRAIEPAQ